MAKLTTTDAIIKAMAKGSSGAKRLTDGAGSDVTTVIPTGIAALDKYVCGGGGLPCGRIVELYGDAGVGKTSLCFAITANAQRLGFVTYFAETESALSSARMAAFGVDLSKVILTEPAHWGEVMEHMSEFLDALPDDQPALVVLDSIAATPSIEEHEHGVGSQAKRDCRAKDLSQFMRRVTAPVKRKKVCLLLVNQIRDNIGITFGSNVTTPGGHAVKFHASLRLHLMGGKKDKDKDGVVDTIAPIAMADKNKVATPFRKARIYLDIAGARWDDDRSTLQLARDLGLMSGRERKTEKAIALLEGHGSFKGDKTSGGSASGDA